MSGGRERLLALATVALSVLITLGALELVLRFLPVGSGLRSMPVTAAAPVFHYEPNADYVYSIGWNFEFVNRGHVNNAGFVNDRDYHADDPSPLIVVVGDSYIEALQVPFPQTLEARLASTLSPRARVYSFAASGSPLSQYLVWAQHAVQQYGARAVIINVVWNDFDESYESYRRAPHFWFYVRANDGSLKLKLFEHRRSLLRSLALESALARYLLLNLRLEHFIAEAPFLHGLLADGAPAQPAAPADLLLDADADAERSRISYDVIDAVFRDVPRMIALPPERILFVVDGYHYPDIAAASAEHYYDRMRKIFLARAKAEGYGAIDLQPFFFAHFSAHHQPFEVPHDGHWNGIAHELVAEAVQQSGFLERSLNGRAPVTSR
jgi:hypothetical protein